jgi:hypothetical protein
VRDYREKLCHIGYDISGNAGLAVPWLKRLVAGLSVRKPRFAPSLVHVGFVVDKVALEQGFLRVLQFSSVSIIPPLFDIHLSPSHEVCDALTEQHNITPSVLCYGLHLRPGTWLQKSSKKYAGFSLLSYDCYNPGI